MSVKSGRSNSQLRIDGRTCLRLGGSVLELVGLVSLDGKIVVGLQGKVSLAGVIEFVEWGSRGELLEGELGVLGEEMVMLMAQVVVH